MIWGIWHVTEMMAPYLLFGFAIAGVLSVFLSPEWLERHLGDKKIWSVVKASLLGVPLPLCSCSVIPVAVSLRKHGASRAATTSFLLSTPQTGVDSILVSYALLGPFFAIFRPLAALITGIVGGIAVLGIADEQVAKTPPKGHACCASHAHGNRLVHALYHGFIAIPSDIGIALTVGIVIAGVIGAWVPEDMFANYLGGGAVSILLTMAMGVPLYVCATASVPIALGLMHAGASPGAAIAFLIAGPATNAATWTTIWKIMGMKTSLIYLATVAASAFSCGMIIDAFFADAAFSIAPIVTHDGHGYGVWAIVLIAVMIVSYTYKFMRGNDGHEHSS